MAGAKRVFWTDDEKERIGARMHEVLVADPALSLIQAVRLAQQVLPEDRQREIIAWSVVQANIEPQLEKARAAASTQTLQSPAPSPPPLPAAVPSSAPAPSAEAAAASESLSEAPAPADAGPSTGDSAPASLAQAAVAALQPLTADPLQLEAAWLVALQSPAVEACLVDLFGRAMSKAFAQLNADKPASVQEPAAPAVEGRVLLAGFPASVVKPLEDALSGLCEVRVWKPGQSQQLFETTARICRLAVIPEGMGDEAEDFLRSLSLKVLRHEGGAGRLVEKVQEALA